MKHTSSIVPAALLALTISSVATPAGAQGSAPLNETDRRAVVESAAKMLRERYVFPDIGTKAASAIESALAGGSYAGLDQLAEFAQRLTEDLAAVAQGQASAHHRSRSSNSSAPARNAAARRRRHHAGGHP